MAPLQRGIELALEIEGAALFPLFVKEVELQGFPFQNVGGLPFFLPRPGNFPGSREYLLVIGRNSLRDELWYRSLGITPRARQLGAGLAAALDDGRPQGSTNSR